MKRVLNTSDGIFQLHIDATGSLIKNSGRKTLLYSVVAKIPLPHVKAVCLLEWLTERHNRSSIGTVLQQWYYVANKILPCPDLVICDWSWALLHAASITFGEQNLRMQIITQWNSMLTGVFRGFVLRLCANHLIHMVSRRLKQFSTSKKVFLIN